MTPQATNAPSTTPPPSIVNGVLDLIGNTPMLRVSRLDTGPCELFLKLESQNPGLSIKDRIAVAMIDAAERDGRLGPGAHLVEGTAGNTGIALALVARQKGYALTVVMPDKMSEGKIAHLRAMGARVVLTRSDVEKGHPEYYQDMAQRIADETPNSFYVNQFCNPANPDAHYSTTGPEIWNQMDGRIDAFVAGIGSGGTMAGVGRYLKEKNPDVTLVAADPAGSIIAPLVNEGRKVDPGAWLVEGIGEDFVPDILPIDLIDVGYAIPDREAFLAARELLNTEGLLGGSSTGTLLAAALRYCRDQSSPKRVVTFVCDSGSRYMDKVFNDFWLTDQGFLERPQYGDLRDLVARRHLQREDYTVGPDTHLLQVFKTMRLYDVSQLVVVDAGDEVVGIIDESDLLLAVTRDHDEFTKPVSAYMTRNLKTVAPTDSIDGLMPIFDAGLVAIVMDNGRYYGMITRIDLLNYLRKRLP
jgi:cystathionine beta-synthase